MPDTEQGYSYEKALAEEEVYELRASLHAAEAREAVLLEAIDEAWLVPHEPAEGSKVHEALFNISDGARRFLDAESSLHAAEEALRNCCIALEYIRGFCDRPLTDDDHHAMAVWAEGCDGTVHEFRAVLKEWDEREAAEAAENAKYACPKCHDQKRYMVMRPGMYVDCSECAVGEQQKGETK